MKWFLSRVNFKKFFSTPVTFVFLTALEKSPSIQVNPRCYKCGVTSYCPLTYNFAILNPHNAVCELGNLVIVSNHYNGLIKFSAGTFQKP